MERITGKQVQSMMEALNHVYAQPEVEQLDENRNRRGEAVQANREAQERARVEADRRVQAAGGGAKAEAEELARLKAANVRPKGPGSQRWRPASDQALTTQARYNVRQRGQEALKKNPDFQAPEKANAPAPSKPKPKPKPGETPPPSPAPAAQTVAAKNASGQQQQVTVGRKYEATLGGQKGTVTYDAAGKRTFTANKPVAGDTAPTTPAGNTAADKTTTPPAKPVPTGTTADGTKFERRLPTMAELRAAQAARAAAKAAGTDRAGQEAAAVKAGVTQAQRQASVDASIKAANRPEVLNRPAPAGSALRAQQDRLAAQKAATTAANTTTAANKLSGSGALAPTGAKPVPTTTSTSVAPKPVGTPIQSGVKPVAGAPTAPAANTKFGTAPAPKPAAAAPAPKVEIKKKPLQTQSADLFDIVKGELLDEGYSEEDAMYIMANLNEEQLDEIVGFLRKQLGKHLLKNKDVLLKKASKLPVVGDLVNRARGIPPLPKIEFESPIRTRAQDVVRSQRLGVSGNADELNQMQQAAQSSLDRMSTFRQGTRRSADLNAKSLERQVRRANAYGPQTSSSKPFAQVIEPPKPTGSKPGVVKLDRYGNPIK